MANNVITAYDGNGQNPITLTQLGSTNTYIDNITSIPYTVTFIGNKYYYHSMYIPEVGNTDYDFIGFSFNGVTSEKLGIIRTSDGSRYDEQMIPNFQDVSAQMPGSDYTLYWESFYNTRSWNINIAFDHMTDSQMRLFRQTFDTKKMGELRFAEFDNNVKYPNGIHWLAKVQAPPQLKYICFEEDGERIYKGEGSISFIAYYPFGMSDIQERSFIKKESNVYSLQSLEVNNTGDLPMDWYVILSRNPARRLKQLSFYKTKDNTTTTVGVMNFNPIQDELKTIDTCIKIDTKTNLLESGTLNPWTLDGKLYNKYLISGDFFKIEKSEEDYTYKFELTLNDNATYPLIEGSVARLGYRYLYL